MMKKNKEPGAATPVIKLFGKTITQADDMRQVAEFTSPARASAEEVVADEETTSAAAEARAEARAGLLCPRCKSKETKFCYFNNYNVNQPRHFCKACHRYWTAGGTLRNVPVGAGRRKNHRPSSSTEAAEEEVN